MGLPDYIWLYRLWNIKYVKFHDFHLFLSTSRLRHVLHLPHKCQLSLLSIGWVNDPLLITLKRLTAFPYLKHIISICYSYHYTKILCMWSLMTMTFSLWNTCKTIPLGQINIYGHHLIASRSWCISLKSLKL